MTTSTCGKVVFLILIFTWSALSFRIKTVNFGQDFKIQCKYQAPETGRKSLLRPRWSMPSHVRNSTRLRMTSPKKVFMGNTIEWRNEIVVKSSEVEDSGLYECTLSTESYDDYNIPATDDIRSLSNNRTQKKLKSVFISVIEENTLLPKTPALIEVEKGSDLVMPCRMIRAEATIRMNRVPSSIKINGSRTSFDPAIGYIVHDVTDKHAGLWKCNAKYENITTSRMTMVRVYTTDDLANIGDIEIYLEPNNVNVVNDTISVRCEVPCENANRVKFQWIFPDNSNLQTSPRIEETRGLLKRHVYTTPGLEEKKLCWGELKIRSSQLSDAGRYSCSVMTGRVTKKASIEVQVMDIKYARNGTSFRLQCKYEVPIEEKNPRLKPRWRVPQHISDTGRLTRFGPKQSRSDSVIQWTNEILVTAAEVDDSGLYQCELYMGDVNDLSPTDDVSWIFGKYSIPRDRRVRSVLVSVYDDKTLLTSAPESIQVEKGSDLILPCKKTIPQAQVKIIRILSTFELNRMREEPGVGYRLSGASDIDSGLWKCQASYHGINSSRIFIVRVYTSSEPNIGEVEIYTVPGKKFMINDTVLVRCEVLCEKNKRVQFDWSYPRKDDLSVAEWYEVTYGRIQKEKPRKTHPRIPILPLTPTDTQDVWWSDIQIWRSQLTDAGEYSCIVTSSEISRKASTYVQVIESSYIRIIYPKQVENTTTIISVEGVEGYRTEIVFEIEAFPDPEFQWFKNGKFVQENETILTVTTEKGLESMHFLTSLIFTDTKAQDAGIYEIRISTEDKYEMLPTRVTVRVPSSPTINGTLTQGQTSLKIGDDIQLSCDAEGGPHPIIHWYHDSTLILENSTIFSLKRVKLEDAGNYTCVATNDLGQAMQSVFLHIKDPNQGNTIALASGIPTIVLLLAFLGALLVKKSRKIKMIKQKMAEAQRYLVPILDPKEMPLEEQAERLSYDPKKWEIPRDRLKFGKTLGRGAFGRVVQATAFDINKSSSCKTVAVKMLKAGSRSSEYRALMSELKILIHLGPHLNIVNLLGACTTKDGPLMIVVEYCRNGNLSNYLRSMRDRYVGHIQKQRVESKDVDTDGDLHDRKGSSGDDGDTTDIASVSGESAFVDCTDGARSQTWAKGNKRDSTTSCISVSDTIVSEDDIMQKKNRLQSSDCEGTNSMKRGKQSDEDKDPDEKTSLTTVDLLSYSLQVARGMEFLSSKLCIHRDLAARNILLSDYQVVKICDFGLARDVYKDPDYVRSGDARLPLKWMAPESIFDKVYSTKSDVWSYGVLLWEIFSLGASPYPGIQIDEDFCNKLKRGVRMRKPQYSLDQIYSAMLACWANKPEERPTFTRLAEEISDILQNEAEYEYLDMLKIFEMNMEGKLQRGVKPVQEPDETFEDIKIDEKDDRKQALITAVDYTDIDMKASVLEKKQEAEEDACTSASCAEFDSRQNVVCIDVETPNERTRLVSDESFNDSGMCDSNEHNSLYPETSSSHSFIGNYSSHMTCESPPSYTTVIQELK